jgi:hypothetical protein
LKKEKASRKTPNQVFQVEMKTMKTLEARQAYRMRERVRLIREQRESGLTIRAWCAANHIKESTYYYWLQVIRKAALQADAGKKASSEQAIVRIGLPETIEPVKGNVSVPSIRLQYKNAALDIPPGVKAADLTVVLKVLDSI